MGRTFIVTSVMATSTVLAARFETDEGEARFYDDAEQLVATFARYTWLSVELSTAAVVVENPDKPRQITKG